MMFTHTCKATMVAAIVFVVFAVIANVYATETLKFQRHVVDDVNELINFLKKPFVPERFKPQSYFKQLGLNYADRLKAFTWKNCDGSAESLQELILSPDPLQFPGKISFSVKGTLNKTLSDPLNAQLVVKKKAAGTWITLPCIDGFGSCSYNICDLLATVTDCPSQLEQIHINCRCPLKEGSYKLPTMSVDVDADAIPEGDYQVKGTVKDKNQNEVACLEIMLSVA